MADETRTPQADPPEGSRDVIERELRRRKQQSERSEPKPPGPSGDDRGTAAAPRPRRAKH